MNGSCIPYTRVPHSTDLLVDYLYHYGRVSRFYNGAPNELSSYQKLAEAVRGREVHRKELVELLTRQNRALGCGEQTLANIQRLDDPGTFAVVTGQQVGLFSGPAFTLYKALTAVRLSQWLTEQGVPSVPIFWLATEDHDLEEVAESATLDEDYNLIPLKVGGERPAPRSPVGHVNLTAEVTEALNQLENHLPPGPPRDQLLRDLRETYQPGTTWSQAFARFMTRLFTRWGVILIEPMDEAVHGLSREIFRYAIEHAGDLRARVTQQSQALVRQGYHAQVHIAEDSTLVFVTREGNRLGLHELDGQFSLEGQDRTSLAELQSWLANRPLDFSPNVLLRPVVQDTILPTIAYVAGPSELAYHGQARVLYEAFERPQPVVLPRSAFTLVDARTQRLLEKYHLEVQDVWKGEEHLAEKIAAVGFSAGWAERFEQSERELAQLLERLHQDIEKVDPTLLDTLAHVKEKMNYQMERLKGKVTRAAMSRSELLGKHQQALLRFLMPHKDLQERRVGGVYFLGRVGYELLERLLPSAHVRCSDHQVLEY